MLEAGQESGVLKEEGKKMINSIFAFDDKLAYEVMTPRTDVFMIDLEDPVEEYFDDLMTLRHSRIPVCIGERDNIIGILHIKDYLIKAREEGYDKVDIKSTLRNAYFIPETKNIDSLLVELQKSKQQIAILIDEYGGFSGIVTMEDIIEEVVGNIDDEYDEEAEIIDKIDETTYLVDGDVDLDDLDDEIGINLQSDNSETIGDLVLGEGMPKICIPLTGTDREEIIKEAELVNQAPCQMAEWRADYMLEALKADKPKEQGEALRQVLRELRDSLSIPIIFTLRTKKEGGQADLSKSSYYFINKMIAESKMADFIDIQAFEGPEQVDEHAVRDFISCAHENGIRVLLSNHDFEKTPDLEEMLARFFVMQELGGDLMKLAVMPNSEEDVFCLLEVSALLRDTYAEIPFIALSMGQLGASTRICGGEFGSVMEIINLI